MRAGRLDRLRGGSAKAHAAVVAVGVIAATILGIDDVRARLLGRQEEPPAPLPDHDLVAAPQGATPRRRGPSVGDDARVAASIEAILGASACPRLVATLVDVARRDTPASETASGPAAALVQADPDLSDAAPTARVAAAVSGLGPAAEADAVDDLHRSLAGALAAASPSCFERGWTMRAAPILALSAVLAAPQAEAAETLDASLAEITGQIVARAEGDAGRPSSASRPSPTTTGAARIRPTSSPSC